jgi:ABC-type dipeptide/oligopeptide/nickel transport system permease component
MLHTIPGDYATALLLGGEEVYETATQAQIDEVREKLGLSGSLPEQYGRWLGDFFRGDFGTSWHTRQSVAERMGTRIITSFELGVLAVTIACSLGVVGGVIAAVRQDKWIDYALRASSMTLQAMPSFWLALIVIVLLVLVFEWIPSISYAHLWEDPLRNLEVLHSGLHCWPAQLRRNPAYDPLVGAGSPEGGLRPHRRRQGPAPEPGAVRPRAAQRFAAGGYTGRV